MAILVIEDEDDVRLSTIDVLQAEGFETIQASNGFEGLQIANEQSPDLILCDISMPRIDGYEALLQLRLNPKTWLIPFIFLTARTSKKDMRKGMNLGADDYLVKPFQPAELIETVSARLDKQNLVETAQANKERASKQQSSSPWLPKEVAIPLTIIREQLGLLRKLHPEFVDTPEEKILDCIDSAAKLLQKIAQTG